MIRFCFFLVIFISFPVASTTDSSFEDELTQNFSAEKEDFKDFPADSYHSSPEIFAEENFQKYIKYLFSLFPGDYISSLEKVKVSKTISRRGLAGANVIYLNPDKMSSKEEFRRVFIHEIGHVFDLGYLVSSENKIASNFKDGTQTIFADDPSLEFYSLCWSDEFTQNKKCKNKDFVSGYAQTDVFEDFAESFLLFIENRNSFKLMAEESEILKKKYDFLAAYFSDIISGVYPEQKSGKRLYDLTLAY